MPNFALRNQYFQERVPGAFGIRYLLATTNIIQDISILSTVYLKLKFVVCVRVFED